MNRRNFQFISIALASRLLFASTTSTKATPIVTGVKYSDVPWSMVNGSLFISNTLASRPLLDPSTSAKAIYVVTGAEYSDVNGQERIREVTATGEVPRVARRT